MLCKIQVRLDQEEFESLYELACAELRSPAEQARYLLRKVLLNKGFHSAQRAEDRQALPASVIEGSNGKGS